VVLAVESIIPFSWRLPDIFVRSSDGALHRVVRHATTTETIAKLESIPSNYHLDCECKLDNGETLSWIGNNQYRQTNGGAIYTAETDVTTPRGDARKGSAKRNAPEAYRAAPHQKLNAGHSPLPLAVINLKTGNDWSLIRAWREHLNISTADMAARLGVDHSIYIELERPRPRPRQVVLDRVSEALGVSPDQLDDSLLGGRLQ